ncbi:MAG TPA: hypothetical protein VMZ11_05570 [Mycobacteriales bacterium]|nr:hypothetical protein [Mycobacteriales bacterium]
MLRRRPDRPDPHELAAERLRASLEPSVPLPPELHRRDRKRLVLWVVMGALAVAVLRDGLGRGAPDVKGSCDRPAFAFDHDEVRQDGVVKWSVTGPTGSSVVVTADSTTPDSGRLLGPVRLKGCKGSGRFGAPLTDGDHVLRVFLLQEGEQPQQIGSRTLTVNAAR